MKFINYNQCLPVRRLLTTKGNFFIINADGHAYPGAFDTWSEAMAYYEPYEEVILADSYESVIELLTIMELTTEI